MYYCVVNMSGVVVCMLIQVLGNVMLLFLLNLVDKGWKQVCDDDLYLLNGFNVYVGKLIYFVVGKVFGIDVLLL